MIRATLFVLASLLSKIALAAGLAGIPFMQNEANDPQGLKVTLKAIGAYKEETGQVYLPVIAIGMHVGGTKNGILTEEATRNRDVVIEEVIKAHGVQMPLEAFIAKAGGGEIVIPAKAVKPEVMAAFEQRVARPTVAAASAPTANPAPAVAVVQAVTPEQLKAIEAKSAAAAAAAAAATVRTTEVVAKVDADVKARNALNGKVQGIEAAVAELKAAANANRDALRKQGDVKSAAVAAAQAAAREEVIPFAEQAASAAEVASGALGTAKAAIKVTGTFQGAVSEIKREFANVKPEIKEANESSGRARNLALFALVLAAVALVILIMNRRVAKPAETDAAELSALKTRVHAQEAQLHDFGKQLRCVAHDGDKSHSYAMAAAQLGATNAQRNADDREVLRSHARQIANLGIALEIDQSWTIAPAEVDAIKAALGTLEVGQRAECWVTIPSITRKLIIEKVAEGEYIVHGITPPKGQKVLPIKEGNVLISIVRAYFQKRIDGVGMPFINDMIAEKASATA